MAQQGAASRQQGAASTRKSRITPGAHGMRKELGNARLYRKHADLSVPDRSELVAHASSTSELCPVSRLGPCRPDFYTATPFAADLAAPRGRLMPRRLPPLGPGARFLPTECDVAALSSVGPCRRRRGRGVGCQRLAALSYCGVSRCRQGTARVISAA